MNGGQISNGIWYALVLMLVGSSLLSRRIPWRTGLKMVVAWGVIFGLVLVAVSYRRDLGTLATRLQSDLTGVPRQMIEGETLRIAMADDGHYWVDGAINGKPTRFLIDTGATYTALTDKTARAAGLDLDHDIRAPLIINTANGEVEAQRSHISTLAIGPIHATDLPVVVSPAFGEVNVLGMNLLSQLKSWRVERNEMILAP